MMSDLENAKSILTSGEYTCALCKGEHVYTSAERGIKPLVVWYESDLDLKGFSAADKVIGKGAAFLYLLLGVKSIYANVISSPALKLLLDNGVCVEYGSAVNNIINRRGDGICPFELAVTDISSPKDAYITIRKKMKELNIDLI